MTRVCVCNRVIISLSHCPLDLTSQDVTARLSDIDRELRFVNDSYSYISSVVTTLLANVSGSQTELNDAQQVNCENCTRYELFYVYLHV